MPTFLPESPESRARCSEDVLFPPWNIQVLTEPLPTQSLGHAHPLGREGLATLLQTQELEQPGQCGDLPSGEETSRPVKASCLGTGSSGQVPAEAWCGRPPTGMCMFGIFFSLTLFQHLTAVLSERGQPWSQTLRVWARGTGPGMQRLLLAPVQGECFGLFCNCCSPLIVLGTFSK